MLTSLLLLTFSVTPGTAHCQIPCGIYGDETRFELMEEHIKTIEKSMNQIETLSKAKKVDYNQLVRWVGNKDLHAEELSDIITYYFMAQRIKPAGKNNAKYAQNLTQLHELLVLAMKAKQSTDHENIKKLRAKLKRFKEGYLGKKPAKYKVK
jgi:hypothetical protein